MWKIHHVPKTKRLNLIYKVGYSVDGSNGRRPCLYRSGILWYPLTRPLAQRAKRLKKHM